MQQQINVFVQTKMKKIIILLVLLMIPLALARDYNIIDYSVKISYDPTNFTSEVYNDTTSNIKVSYHNNLLNKTKIQWMTGTKKFDDCKSGNDTYLDNCDDVDYEAHLQRKMTETEYYDWTLINPQLENATYANVIAEGFVEADDVIIHSAGISIKDEITAKEELFAISNLPDGKIDPSTVSTEYKTEDGKGIYMWKYFLSLFTTNIRNVWDKTDSLEAENKKLNDRITILEGVTH